MLNISYQTGLTYSDVLLKPQLGIAESRSVIDLSTKLTARIHMGIPIVSAPMSSVTDGKMAKAMKNAGGFGLIHRNQSIDDQVEMYLQSGNPLLVYDRSPAHDQQLIFYSSGCAIGINDDDRLQRLMYAGCQSFCLDVAHAHTESVADYISKLPENIDLIVGSIATAEAVYFLAQRFPISGFRVGIGPGSVCTTRTQTGFGMPQLTAISECADAAYNIPIIADGGIHSSGDIVKALAAGASSVMLGRLLASAEEAPKPGEYYGMASAKAKEESDGCSKSHIEGIEMPIRNLEPLEDILKKLTHGIRSGISYGGGTNIRGLQENHEFILVSEGTRIENGVVYDGS